MCFMTTNHTTTDQTLHFREAFEKAAKAKGFFHQAGEPPHDTLITAAAWWAWQEAWNTSAQSSAPEGGEDVAMARRFHEAYERLAPSFGYETRKETREFDTQSPNGRLMIAVCAEIYTINNAQGEYLQKVAAFLMGEGELEGCHFGEKQPWHKGNFWWRNHLKAALSTSRSNDKGTE